MPSSASDRFTVDFEKVFFFTKNNKPLFWTNSKTGNLVHNHPLGTKGIEDIDWEWREDGDERKKVTLWQGHDYWFEQQFEPYLAEMNRWGGEELKADGESNWDEGTGQITYRNRSMRPNKQGRNKRCVWKYDVGEMIDELFSEEHSDEYRRTALKHLLSENVHGAVWDIPTQPSSELHFAQFPDTLVIPMLSAGCTPNGIVLDPFADMCTVAKVAIKQKRNLL